MIEGDCNNQKARPPVLFQHLSDTDKASLLNKNGHLYGIRTDGIDCPRRSAHRVAKYKTEQQEYPPSWIREVDNILTEIIPTQNERDSNYVHHGWSLSATTTVPPWTASRIAKTNQANQNGSWTTKRTTAQRLIIDIPLEDLVPEPAFELHVREALQNPNSLDKFRALHMVFQLWGDVVPLVFDLGVSLTITDTEKNFIEISSFKTARVNIQGGDTNDSLDNITTWLSKDVHPLKWSQARIIRAVPITDLLSNELKTQIKNLYSSLLSFQPSVLDGSNAGGESFDDTPLALKTIEKITIHSDHLVDSITVSYADGITSNRHGGSDGKKQEFNLRKDEFVVEAVVWSDQETVCGLQFITNEGRASPHFGGDCGRPSVISCDGGALTAFSGKIKKNSYWKKNMVCRIQGIWRHDIVPVGSTRGHQYSAYFGGDGGVPFFDWPYTSSSDSASISRITVKCGTYIDNIKATHRIKRNGITSQSIGMSHGGAGGQDQTFALEPDEYIVSVLGRHDDWLVQLCFVTNRGKTSPAYGGSGGRTFKCEAPPGPNGEPMGLCTIMGKSSNWLNGLLFVWAPV